MSSVLNPHQDLTQPRLPSHITPKRYDLALAPNLHDWTFQGYVSIHISVKEPTKFIQLHAWELQFHSVKLSLGWAPPKSKSCYAKQLSGHDDVPLFPPVQVAGHVFDETSQRALITLDEIIQPGIYTLEITFSGELNNKMAGFYRSVHVDPNSNISYRCALTQFEATDARLCFPCWDEPAHKAVFGCTLVAESRYKSLSCAAVSLESIVTVASESGQPGASYSYGFENSTDVVKPGFTVTEFHDTPIMSTYLLAFVVGDFDYVQRKSQGGVDVRVYTPPGDAAKGMFSLDLACRALDYFADYFQIPYVMTKLDLVAAADVAANAMENWGLITYRATRLLVDADSTSRSDLISLSRTVCHEIAHMWFGNLVTMEWWTQLWLNEGFARYMEFKAVNALYPEWRVWDLFVSQVVSLAQNLDKMKSSHPIEVEVNMPEEINAIFDAISYAKGASVLKMLADFMGDSFMEGVRKYLKRYQFSNAVSSNLWDSLQEAYDEQLKTDQMTNTQVFWEGESTDAMNIRTIMRAWTTETNFPIVNVKKVSYDASTRAITFTLSQQSIIPDLDDKRLWPILLPILTPSGDTATVVFNGPSCNWSYILPESISPDDALFKFNYKQSGFVHVCYVDGTPSSLKKAIKESSAASSDQNGLSEEKGITAIDRLGVLADMATLLSLQKVSVSEWLESLQWYEGEDNAFVLESLCSVMRTVFDRHAATKPSYQKAFGEYLAKRLESTYERLQWGENEQKRDPQLDMKRATVISTLARLSPNEQLSKKGIQMFEESLRSHPGLFPEITDWEALPKDGNGSRITGALSKILCPKEAGLQIPVSEGQPDALVKLTRRIIQDGALAEGSTVTPYNPTNIRPDFRHPVYALTLSYCFAQCHAVGDEAEAKVRNYYMWMTLFTIFSRLHQSAASHDESNRLLRILCALPTNNATFPDARDRSELLFEYCNSEHVRGQDRIFGYRSLDTPCILKMLMNDWDSFYAKLKAGSHAMIPAVMNSLLSKFSGYAMAELFEEFFLKHPCPEGASTIAQVSETIAENDICVQHERYDLARSFEGK